MNVFQKVQVWLHGSDRPAPTETTTYSSVTYSSGDNDRQNQSASQTGAFSTGDPNRRPAHCPDCGSREAGAEWNRERTSVLLTCPDCGLSQCTELLASDEAPLAWRHGH